jgi:glycosyltransferase involved in cell wall biosynthesis
VTATPTERRLPWNGTRTIRSVTTLDGEARGRIFVLVPAHDEAPKIARVVEGAGRHVPLVLVVDDGSADATAALAEGAGARVIRQSPTQGKGAALRAGFAAALAAGAEAVITLDGDGQHDPAELPSFLGAYARRTIAGEPSELIVGKRSFRRMPIVRRLANGLGTVVLSAALGRWIADNQSGYRLIGRRLMTAMLESHEDGFAFEVEMIAVCLREGWPIDWVPVRTIYAGERSHIEPVRHLREFLGVTRRARQVANGARTTAAGATQRPGVEPTPGVEG